DSEDDDDMPDQEAAPFDGPAPQFTEAPPVAPNGCDDLRLRARSVLIEDEIEARGIELEEHGAAERVGPCPLCGGEDRFSINTENKVFNCRGCQKGGDVIDLVEHLDDVDFVAACQMLTGELERPAKRLNGSDYIVRERAKPEAREVFVREHPYNDENGK